jgi:hypothetical protein
MINFKPKHQVIENLMSEAIEHLSECGQRPNLITLKDADKVSRVNSRAMVLREFIKNSSGNFQISLQDKELYNYTQKLVRDIFRMKILDIDKKNRIITAETESKGIALDIIEILGLKYNLSIVQV